MHLSRLSTTLICLSALAALFLLVVPLRTTSAAGVLVRGASPSAADIKVAITPTTGIELFGPATSDLTGAFFLELQGGTVHSLTIQSGDLVGVFGDRIPGSSVAIAPALLAEAPTSGDPATLRRFSVTVPADSAMRGPYVGALYVQYAELADHAPLVVPLTATFASRPVVSVAVNSANQTLFVHTCPGDIPYVGVPAPISPAASDSFAGGERFCRADALGSAPVFLEETALTTATVRQAIMLNVRRSDGYVLPDGVVTAAVPPTGTVPAGGAIPVQVTLGGHNLPAGAYQGTLRVNIAYMATPVEAALNFNIKHNQVWALLTLAASFVVFFLTGLYNRNLPRYRLASQAEARQRALENLFVAADRRSVLRTNLSALMDAILNDVAESEVNALLKAYDAQVNQALADARVAVDGEFEPVAAEIGALRTAFEDAGNGVPEPLMHGLQARADAIRNRIAVQDYRGVEPALADIAVLDSDIDLLRQLQANWNGLDPDLVQAARTAATVPELVALFRRSLYRRASALQAEVADGPADVLPPAAREAVESLPQRIDDAGAGELDELLAELKRLRQLYDGKGALPAGAMAMPQAQAPNVLAGVGEAGARRFDSLSAEQTRIRAWRGLRYHRRIVTVMAIFVAYLVALSIGWATLYFSSPTFGATPRDYLDLFFWGAAVNFVAGQSINLKNLYSRDESGD